MRSLVGDHPLPPLHPRCSLLDFAENDAFKGSNLRVIGISPDSVEDQDTFVKKQKLTYPVLSDSAGEFRRLYGVGKGIMGLVEARVTFFIDSKGTVRYGDTEQSARLCSHHLHSLGMLSTRP